MGSIDDRQVAQPATGGGSPFCATDGRWTVRPSPPGAQLVTGDGAVTIGGQ